MHVGGAPGSGKTYLGKVLKSQYKDLKVIDTDMLKDKFIEKPIKENMELMEKLTKFNSFGKKSKSQIKLEKEYENRYKSFVINKLTKLHKQKEKYLLVGHFFMFDDLHIDIPVKNKIYLDVKDKTLFTRRNGRLINDIVKNKDYFVGLVNDGEEFWNYNYLWSFTNLKDLTKQLSNTKKYYVSHKYKPLDEEKIKKIVDKEMK